MSDLDVIKASRGLTQFEKRFRTMKRTLHTRPIHLRDPDHISGHPVLCTVALIIIALIQCKVKKKEAVKDSEKGTSNQKWALGIDPDRIHAALNALQVEPMPDNYIRFRLRSQDQAGADLQRILDAHDIMLAPHLYTPGDLRSLGGSIKVL